MPELNINELKWIASFYSARNLQKISASDYDQLARLIGRGTAAGGEEEGGKGQGRYDEAYMCEMFRERYRLPGNASVCRNAGAHDEVDGAAGAGRAERGMVRGCARALVEAVPLCICDKFTSRRVDCAYLVAQNFILKTFENSSKDGLSEISNKLESEFHRSLQILSSIFFRSLS